MTKKEYFQQRLVNLSGRSKKIISSLGITCDNIHSVTRNQLMRNRNCGNGSISEILALSKDICERYRVEANVKILKEVPIEQHDFYKFGLSSRAKYALKGANIYDVHTLKEAAHDNYASIRRQVGIGSKTIKEICELADSLNINKPTITNNPVLAKYYELKTEYVDTLLQNLFLQLLDDVSPTLRKHIESAFCSFLDVLTADVNNFKIDCCVNETRERIVTELSSFQLYFKDRAEQVLSLDPIEMRRHYVLSTQLNYLCNDELDFVKQYYKAENCFPMFFLLYKYFEKTISKRKEVVIFIAYVGIFGKRKTIQELSDEYSLSKERIRQICCNFKNSHYISTLPFVDDQSWEQYSFLNQEFLTIENTDFKALIDKEHLSIDFYVFCKLCSLVQPRFEILCFVRNGNKINYFYEPQRNAPVVYLFAYDVKYKNFNFINVIQYINKLYYSPRRRQNKILLYMLCAEKLYWKNDNDLTLIKDIVSIISYIVHEIYHINPQNGIIYFEKKQIEIKKFLFQCIVKHGGTCSVDELLSEYKNSHPNSAQMTSKLIRYYLRDRKCFTPIGKKNIYSITESPIFCGTNNQIVISLLYQAKAPLSRKEILQEASLLSPNIKQSSIRTTIYNLLKEGRLVNYPNFKIGLADSELFKSI